MEPHNFFTILLNIMLNVGILAAIFIEQFEMRKKQGYYKVTN